MLLVARDPDTVLGPDIAFIRGERLAAEPLGEGFGESAPDLAVEVLPPGQAPREGHDKALAWLDAGAEILGRALLPGFRCPIADLFPAP